MRRKFFQDVANTLPEMLMGWRMGSDVRVLAELPNGVLELDVLRGTAVSAGKPVDLHVARELQAWLQHSLEERGVPGALDRATLRANLSKEGVGVVVLTWDITSEIVSGEDEYGGRAQEVHRWHLGSGA